MLAEVFETLKVRRVPFFFPSSNVSTKVHMYVQVDVVRDVVHVLTAIDHTLQLL